MRCIEGALISGLAAVLGLLISCGGSGRPAQLSPAEEKLVAPAAPSLPGLSGLDGIHAALAVQDHEIPVTEPISQRHTQVSESSLEFIPPADELAYALYRIDPPGPPLKLSAAGEGPLWLLVADYGVGKWIMEPFVDGHAEIDLTALDSLFSPDGYMYNAVVCPAGEGGRLDAMTLEYDELEWGLTISADEESTTLTWNELDVDSYEAYRSTLENDEAPYHVGTVIEEHTGGNSFTETVPEDGSGRWVPENNVNGTPDEPEDDFPTIAPAVEYYYRLVPVIDGHRYAPSPEVSAEVAWGDRWSGNRNWPDTTAQTRSIAVRLRPELMTEAQIEWMANHYAGALDITQAAADRIRAYNPDFIALGEQWASYASQSDHGSCYYIDEFNYGNEVDAAGDFPYIDRHEDWFIHADGSDVYHQRIYAAPQDPVAESGIYWLEPDGLHMEYLAANMLQFLGENHFDGCVLGFTEPLPYSWDLIRPGEGDAGFADYWRPKVLNMLNCVTQLRAEHARAPFVLAGTHNFMFYGRDGEMDYSPCDGIVVDTFLMTMLDEWNFGSWRFPAVMNNALAAQHEGQVLILNSPLPSADGWNWTYHRMTILACYLLLRDTHTYLYYNGARGENDAYPLWYPHCGVDTGAPLDPLAFAVDDYLTTDENGNPYYRRDFENCSSIVILDGSKNIEFDPLETSIDYVTAHDCGLVDELGNAAGYWQWEPRQTSDGLYSFNPGGHIVRGLPED